MSQELVWGNNVPTVVGKFWWRDSRYPHEAGIINVTQTKLEVFRRVKPGQHEQFAGPIVEPKEP